LSRPSSTQKSISPVQCNPSSNTMAKMSSPNVVGLMFDRIAPTYSLVNHILSFGRDFSWRRKLADALIKDRRLKVLDLATGSGDLLIEMLGRNPKITEAIGLDIARNMLAICRRKVARHGLSDRATVLQGDAAATAFHDNSFDVVTIAFGIRNTPDVSRTLSEIRRLLKPGGTALALEFSLPSNRIIRALYLVYLRYLVPLIGRAVSRDKNAYRYLNKTIEGFYQAEDFCGLMDEAGFSEVTAKPLTFGIVSLYQAHKPPPA